MSKRAAADGWSLAELEAAARPKKSRANVDPSAAGKILRHARDEFEPTLRALAEDAVESVRNAAKDELEDREW